MTRSRIIPCDLCKRLPARDAGIGDERVEAPESLHRLGDDALVLVWSRDVGAEEQRAAAALLDLRDSLSGLVVVRDVGERDVEATFGEGQDDPAADPTIACSSGDERDRHLRCRESPASGSPRLRTLPTPFPKII